MREKVISTVKDGRWQRALLLAIPALLLGGQASAQQTQARGIINGVKGAVEQRENAPLPDGEAPEGGADAKAAGSVSFQPLQGNRATIQGQGELRVRPPSKVSRSETQDADDAGDADEQPTLDDISGELDESADTAAPAEVPELHTVKSGDTLYTMCKTYFADPYKWPQLWALNPLITNPHWIFPGDVVRLRTTSGDSPVAEDEPTRLDMASPTIASSSSRGQTSGGSVALRETGFLSDDQFRAAGKLTGSREEKIMLATDDQVYVGFPKDQPMSAGERYTVFKVDTEKPIMDAKGEKRLGYLVEIHGDMILEQVADERTGRGVLVDVARPIERDMFVSAQVKQFKRVSPKPSDVNLEAKVVASFSPAKLLSPDDFVVLSRGSRDGMEVGNRAFVIRRGDGYSPVMEGWEHFDDRYPKEVVAEMLVVDVHDDASVAWIARATKEIRVGETTETRKGY